MLWLLGSLFVGFTTGIATYQGILETAQLEVVAQSKLEDLRRNASAAQASGKAIQEPPSQTNPVENEPHQTKNRSSAPRIFELSDNLPFPRNLDAVKPGMRLSTARSVFPDGEMTSSWYSAPLDSGPFRHIAVFVYGSGEDPLVDAVNLQFRNAEAERIALEELFRVLGDMPHRTEMLGERVVWPDVNGYHLAVSDSYAIQRALGDNAVRDQETGEPTAAPDG